MSQTAIIDDAVATGAQTKRQKYELRKAHEALRTLSKDQIERYVLQYHESVVRQAREARMQIRLPKYHQDTMEAQIAKNRQALKHDGYWVQGFAGEIPVLVAETIKSMRKNGR